MQNLEDDAALLDAEAHLMRSLGSTQNLDDPIEEIEVAMIAATSSIFRDRRIQQVFETRILPW